MQFTAEHRALAETVKRFCEQEINPHVKAWEEAEIFPAHEVFKKMCKLGLLGVKYDTAYGGMGLDFSYSMVVAEELGAIPCGGVPMAIGVQTDMCTPALHRFGSDELKKEYLAPAIAGDDYVINGSKMWITNATQADWCCLLANTSEGPVHSNKSLIIVPMDAKGITTQKIKKIGMNSSDTAQIFFDNVRVPRRNLIGTEGAGFMMQMIQFQEERLYGAANSLKMLDKLIDLTIEYCKERHTFGQTLINNQVIHFRLAELRTEVELLRSLVYRAVDEYVQGKDVTKMASMAKLKCGRLIREVADSCLQYWGGMGFTHDNPISQAYRDGRLVSIGGGADEIMLGIICKFEGTLPKKAR